MVSVTNRVRGLGVAVLTGALLVIGPNARPVAAAGFCVNPGGTGGCYASIQAAVDAAEAGATVSVAPGTYHENVVIQHKSLRLMGAGAQTTIIDAVSPVPAEGILVQGVNAETVVSGFTVENAPNEGILIQDSSQVRVVDNIVQDNDTNLHFNSSNPFLSSCAGALPLDGEDCGEGVHLLGTAFSAVANNLIQGNAGGILLTDETGPTHDNMIRGNTVQNNVLDCGITLPSHPAGFGPHGPLPGHGVYNNMVLHNISRGNGGAGVGIFAPTPGTASYDNSVVGNVLVGNGNGGVMMHSHAPDQNLNGNRIINNTIGRNNLAGDADSGDMVPTGIIIFSAVVPIVNTNVAGNTITGNEIGIWLANASDTKLAGNRIDAPTPVFTP